jgi:hypothetical protein
VRQAIPIASQTLHTPGIVIERVFTWLGAAETSDRIAAAKIPKMADFILSMCRNGDCKCAVMLEETMMIWLLRDFENVVNYYSNRQAI